MNIVDHLYWLLIKSRKNLSLRKFELKPLNATLANRFISNLSEYTDIY